MATLQTQTTSLRHLLENIDILCLPSPEIQLELAQLAKCFFDFAVENGKEFGDISELIVQDIDSDSIWEQIQTRDRPLIRYIQSNTQELRKRLLKLPKVEPLEDVQEDSEEQSIEESIIHESDGDSQVSSEELSISGDDLEEGEDQGEEDQNEEDEMEQFLDEIDVAEEKRLAKLENTSKGEMDQEAPIEFEDDLEFASRELYDLPSSDDEFDHNVRYQDFFSAPRRKKIKIADDVGDVSESDQDVSKNDQDFLDREDDAENNSDSNVEDDGVEDEVDESDEDDTKNRNVINPETTHSRQKKKIQDRITEMEQQLIEPKSWDLKGEVASKERPENSLLGLAVSIERASKSAPIVTPEYSKSIEDMIIERIKASNFSNVIVQRMSEKQDARGSAELSQEKSGQGLGELYAEQFMKESLHFDKTEDKLQEVREKILLQFKKVCRQLDGLSHFHFTPKPEASEFGVKSIAVSAISMEDVLPTTQRTSYATNLAPEQLHEKKRGRDAAFLSVSEADRDDRQRLRRAKKATRNRLRKAQAQEAGNPVSINKDKRVVVADDSSIQTKSFSKSANFFSQMQQNAQQSIVRGKKEPKNGGLAESSLRFKL